LASWFTPLLRLSSQIIFLDILWRIMKSINSLKKHWRGTIITFPPADLRATASNQQQILEFWSSFVNIVMTFLTHRLLYVILGLLAIGIVLWTISGEVTIQLT
jgi:hypothetical protein